MAKKKSTGGGALVPIGKLREALVSRADRIKAILPSDTPFTMEQFIDGYCLYVAADKTGALGRCTLPSHIIANRIAARFGLEFNVHPPQVHLVPYRDEVTAMPSYQGLIVCLRRSKAIKDVYPEIVYEGDEFKRVAGYGKQHEWSHVLDPSSDREKKAITYVYAQFIRPDNTIFYTSCMSKDEIDDHARSTSRTYADANSPWQKHWKSMAIKTVIRRPIHNGIIPLDLPGAAVDALVSDEPLDPEVVLNGEILDDIIDVEPVQAFDSDGKPAAAAPLDPAALSADLAACDTEADVQEIRGTYLNGASAPDAATIKEYCVNRVAELMSQKETGDLFEKSANAAAE